jgi:hypothetical protein
MISQNVGFRLSQDIWARYSLEAQQRGLPLGTWLRQRLEEQDRLIVELSLRAAVAHDAPPREDSRKSAPGAEPGTLVEVLLLLRTIAGPQKTAMVQKEVERRGLASWK